MRHKYLNFYIFSILVVVMIFLFVLPLKVEPISATETATPHPGEYANFQSEGNIRRFIGETLHINISFLWFDNAATAQIGLYEKNGLLYSILEAETKGFVGFFTSYRKHFYKASFDLMGNGKRVRSNKFERKVIIGDMENATNHSFEYKTRTHKWEKIVNGTVVEGGSRIIPLGVNFDDILTVFYNFRNSAYGKIQKGAKYTIHTVPQKKADKIHIHIMSREEQNKFISKNDPQNGKEFLLKAIIPKEIFNTDTGELLFWSSEHLIPLETTVKDYILFGDLYAKLSHRDFKPPKIDTAATSIGKVGGTRGR